MEFMGYERPDGKVGVRNTVLVIAVCDCGEPEQESKADYCGEPPKRTK